MSSEATGGRIQPADTIAEFQQAAVARLADARALRSRERDYWAVYTLGYAVEMHLKIAYFRLFGLRETEDARVALRMARPWAKQLGITEPDRNLHGLLFWLKLILIEREFASRPLPSEWANKMLSCVQRVASHWLPEMRYRAPAEGTARFRRVVAATAWIVQNSRVLWN